ncbi:hypothetical protein D3C73_1430550 [compost metagenome]
MAEPVFFSLKVTKYLTPLLAPGVSLNSNDISKAAYSSLVTISPPLVDSAPPEGSTLIVPLAIFHPFSGNAVL